MNGRVRGHRLYMLANSRAGLGLTAVLATIASRLGYRIYLHHHTYRYIDRFNSRMDWIVRCVGKCGAHVVHCPQMIDDFRRQYPAADRFLTMVPCVVPLDFREPRVGPNKPFCLGMLSNLTIDKGLDLAIETFRVLRVNGYDVHLKLAGPIESAAARGRIDAVLREYPTFVKYVGSVYGTAKIEFLQSIDVFLFPTRDESWGLVINEAFACGVPVVTSDRGCTRTVVGEAAGVVVPRDGDYVAVAVSQIASWISNTKLYQSASASAIQQARNLQMQGQQQLDEFARKMFAPLADEPNEI